MPAKRNFVARRGPSSLLNNSEWITIISALMQDSSPESRRLAVKLLEKSKHGRQIRLMRMIQTRCPTLRQMKKTMKVSRRTIFRYLNGLEEYGLTFTIDQQLRYHVSQLPARLRRLL